MPGATAIEYTAAEHEDNSITAKKVVGYVWSPNESAWIKSAIDGVTRSTLMLDHTHHAIHESKAFVISDVQNISIATVKWMVTTPDSLTYAHMIFDIACTGECQILITEGADRTGGTGLTETNRRRVGTPAAATVSIVRTPGGGTTDGATTIFQRRSGGTGQASKSFQAGGERGDNEFVLKANTKYIVAITTYADIFMSANFSWYEHDDLA